MELLFPILLFAFAWFALVRPQRERLRQQRALVASLQPGDEVVTAGGILGRIQFLDDDFVHLEVAPGTTMRILRPAIHRRVPPPDGPVEDR